jgi:hypothetical protein
MTQEVLTDWNNSGWHIAYSKQLKPAGSQGDMTSNEENDLKFGNHCPWWSSVSGGAM